MGQSTHDVRRIHWLNIITECQQRPVNVSVRQVIVVGFVYDVDYSYFREYNYLLRKSETKCIAKKQIICYDKYIAMRGCGLRHTSFDSKIRRRERLTLERNVEIVTGSKKKKIVRIHDIRFQGKRSIDWRHVREYLKDYVGAAYEIAETKDIIYK